MASPHTPAAPMRPRLRLVVEVLALASVPCVLAGCAALSVEQSAALSLLVALGAVAVFLAGYERSRPGLGQIMPTAVLAALAAAGRILFAAVPDVKPVSAVCIMAGASFGRHSGFLVGALAALVSNFFFGQGPWTAWQMYAWGVVGYGAGVLAAHGAFRRDAVLYAYGFASALVYGLLMNGWYVIGFVHPFSWEAAVLAFAAAAPFDVVHGLATVAFLRILYKPWRRKLDRIKTKFGLG